MPFPEVIRQSFERSFALYDELIAALPETSLAQELPGIRSNAIGDQLWCVVGARESYARAIELGRWSGFSCSLSAAATRDRAAVQRSLRESAVVATAALMMVTLDDDARVRSALDLLEHEAAHHGQLIRFLYGLRLPIPSGWKARYALEDPRLPRQDGAAGGSGS